MNDTQKLVPLGALARHLGVPTNWLRAEAEDGRIPCLRAGAQLLFDAEVVERLLLERARKGVEAAP